MKRPPAEFWLWPFNELFADKPTKRRQGVPSYDALRDRHTFCVGGTGSGKTTLVEILTVQDEARLASGLSNRGFLLIDVHGDLCPSLVGRSALVAQGNGALYDKIIVIDVLQRDWSVGLQPLMLRPGDHPEHLALILADVFTTLYHDDATTVNRMRWLMYHIFLALICARRAGIDVSLCDVLRFLRNPEFRQEVLAVVDNQEVQEYFAHEFPPSKHHRDAMQWAESTLDRLGPLVTDPLIAPLLTGNQTVSFRRAMDEGKIILVNAPKGKIGREKSRLLCALIFALVKQAAFSRSDIPKEARVPFTAYLDEAHTYITGDFTEAIAEGRKMRLELFMTGQELVGQLTDKELLSSVINTVDTHIVFRSGVNDCELMAKIMFTPDFDANIRELIGVDGRPQYSFKPTDQVWFEYASALMRLPDRHFYVRHRGEKAPHLAITNTLRPLSALADEVARYRAVDQLLGAVFARYGRPKGTGNTYKVHRVPPSPPFSPRTDEDFYSPYEDID